jgi:hypothetical protein
MLVARRAAGILRAHQTMAGAGGRKTEDTMLKLAFNVIIFTALIGGVGARLRRKTTTDSSPPNSARLRRGSSSIRTILRRAARPSIGQGFPRRLVRARSIAP